nr:MULTISPECIES: hypothetical protein [unclassified Mesorhizobium]
MSSVVPAPARPSSSARTRKTSDPQFMTLMTPVITNAVRRI